MSGHYMECEVIPHRLPKERDFLGFWSGVYNFLRPRLEPELTLGEQMVGITAAPL
jgi:hypothetical protein